MSAGAKDMPALKQMGRGRCYHADEVRLGCIADSLSCRPRTASQRKVRLRPEYRPTVSTQRF